MLGKWFGRRTAPPAERADAEWEIPLEASIRPSAPHAPASAAPINPDALPPEVNARLQAYIRYNDQEPDLRLFTPALSAILADRTLSRNQKRQRIVAHADYAAGWALIEADQELNAMPEGAQRFHRLMIAGHAMAELERELFGNPNELISYTDERPTNGSVGFNHRWTPTYRRMAGSMTERERFVFLMSIAYRDAGLLDEDTAAAGFVSALAGGDKGQNVDWELDPGYSGDKEERNLKLAKERFAPEPLDKLFQTFAKAVFDIAAKQPDHPLAMWGMQTLRPHSAGWATTR